MSRTVVIHHPDGSTTSHQRRAPMPPQLRNLPSVEAILAASGDLDDRDADTLRRLLTRACVIGRQVGVQRLRQAAARQRPTVRDVLARVLAEPELLWPPVGFVRTRGQEGYLPIMTTSTTRQQQPERPEPVEANRRRARRA